MTEQESSSFERSHPISREMEVKNKLYRILMIGSGLIMEAIAVGTTARYGTDSVAEFVLQATTIAGGGYVVYEGIKGPPKPTE